MFDLADGDGPAGLPESPGPERRPVDRERLVGVRHQRVRHEFAGAIGFFSERHLDFGDALGGLLAKPLLSVGSLSGIVSRHSGGFRRDLVLLAVSAGRSRHLGNERQQHETRYHGHSMEAHGRAPRRSMTAAASSIIDGMSGEASPVRNFEFGMKRVEDERWKLENKALRATGGANLSRRVGTAET